MLTLTEENYLKSIFHLQQSGSESVSTNSLSEAMQTKPASVTDMIKKLSDKQVVDYQKYQGVSLTPLGRKQALIIIRRHRLWEVFLSQKLKFAWDEVHEVAEELEHIQSEQLINRLDEFLGFPQYDPHGDPIPDAEGNLSAKPKVSLAQLEPGAEATIIAVKNSSPAFLQYLDKVGALIGNSLQMVDRLEFDGSVQINLADRAGVFMSRDAAENILVSPTQD